jgi:hypothetical protein
MNSVGRRFDAAIEELLHSTMTGEPAYARANGESFWNQLAADAQLAQTFDIDMEQHVGSIGLDLAHTYNWSTISHVIDLGGGTGALLSHLLLEHHHLRGTLVEYADAATRAREILANSVMGSLDSPSAKEASSTHCPKAQMSTSSAGFFTIGLTERRFRYSRGAARQRGKAGRSSSSKGLWTPTISELRLKMTSG